MKLVICLSLLVGSSIPTLCSGFLGASLPTKTAHQSSASDTDTNTDTAIQESERFVDAVPVLSSVTDPEAIQLKDELLALAESTNRGFQANSSERKRAKELIFKLAGFNPTSDPASSYYEENANANVNNEEYNAGTSLAGKWNLIYTDAPDITSLDTSRNPLATATLGRIGQECTPPLIKNVIEWKKPEWVDRFPLPFAGDSRSRILQKVCTKATASPDQPMLVDLKFVGIDLVAPPSENNYRDSSDNGSSKLQDDIERDGLPMGFLKNNPLELRGPLTAPFGQFEILYLDEELRIIKTRGYFAVNERCTKEWF